MAPLVVFFDTNVLLAALLCPGGACRRLLNLAALGIIRPIVTSEVLAEAERHLRLGLGGRSFSDEEIEAFREALAPLFESEQLASSPVGRAAAEGAPLVNVDNRVLLQADPGASGHPRGQPKQTRQVGPNQALLADKGDLHVLAASIRHRCQFLCSSDKKNFPEGFECKGVRAISPAALLALLVQEVDLQE